MMETTLARNHRIAGWLAMVMILFQGVAPALAAGEDEAAGEDDSIPEESPGLSPPPKDTLFQADHSTWMDRSDLARDRAADGSARFKECGTLQFRSWQLTSGSPRPWTLDGKEFDTQLAAANTGGGGYPGDLTVTYWDDPRYLPPAPPSTGKMFFRGWALITTVEMVLLGVTATLPKSWTGWSSQFVKDGWGNFKDAYSDPPVWDTDHWFHNYIGHPYGGSVYYNTMRTQGGDRGHSFLFSLALSVQWEYIFEAVAEQPSIQDLLITPVIGSVLGEAVHKFTTYLRKDGTNFGEKVIITILNPTSVFFNGYK